VLQPAPDTPNRDAGFSLIELLIALAIIAMLLVMVPGTLRLGRRAWETPGQMNDNAGAAALAFATERLKGAMPVYTTDTIGLPSLNFSGSEISLGFIADLAIGPQGGGLYRIEAGPDHATGQLGVRLSLYRPSAIAAKADSLPGEWRDISPAYASLAFRYYGSPKPGQPPQWQANWPRRDRLPDLVDVLAMPRLTTGLHFFEQRTELKLRPLQ
jgi:general secretion pathway protein J